jgi:MoxR-like ATPase
MSSDAQSMQQEAEKFRSRYAAVREQIGRVIVGHDDIVNGVLTAMFVGGHCLLEGVPGLGKTMLIRTLAETLSLEFNRIQFTPDLMPSDILGTNMIVENEGRKQFQFQKGPIFTQICLADEINRATPKTQSALLETSKKEPTRFPKPSWTGFFSNWLWATRLGKSSTQSSIARRAAR